MPGAYPRAAPATVQWIRRPGGASPSHLPSALVSRLSSRARRGSRRGSARLSEPGQPAARLPYDPRRPVWESPEDKRSLARWQKVSSAFRADPGSPGAAPRLTLPPRPRARARDTHTMPGLPGQPCSAATEIASARPVRPSKARAALDGARAIRSGAALTGSHRAGKRATYDHTICANTA